MVAFALLYFFPDDTRHWFAWDVQPTITPLIMGAGYIAGAYFFVRVARETRWHRIHVGFLPVTAFTLFMAIATFNHLQRIDTSMLQVAGTGSACAWPRRARPTGLVPRATAPTEPANGRAGKAAAAAVRATRAAHRGRVAVGGSRWCCWSRPRR